MRAARYARSLGNTRGISALRGHLTPKQLAALDDPRDIGAWCAPRRAGKTELEAVACHDYAIPNETGAFISLTVTKAASLLREKLSEFKRKFNVDYAWDGSKNIARLPNHGMVQCYGLSSMPDVNLIRGGKPPFALIDEAGHIDPERLEYCVNEALQPALGDWWGRGGRGIRLCGSPSEDVNGYWARVVAGQVFEDAAIHHFDILENPLFAGQKGLDYLAAVLRRNNWNEQTPQYLREFRGQFVPDTTTLCVPGWTEGLLPQHMAPTDGLGILGVDFGLRDACGFVVLLAIENHLHAVHAESHSGMTIPDIAALINELFQRFPLSACSGDAYGMGAGYIHTLRESYAVPIDEAKYPEREKASRIDLANGIALAGNLHIYENARPLAQEIQTLIWNKERTHPRDGYPDHNFDAFLIAAGRHRQDFQTIVRNDEEQKLWERQQRLHAQMSRTRRAGGWR